MKTVKSGRATSNSEAKRQTGTIMKSLALAGPGRQVRLLILIGLLQAGDLARQVTAFQLFDSVASSARQLALATGEKPRLIPLVAADSGYGENSSVNILCTVSQGHHDSLQFEWFKDGQPIDSSSSSSSEPEEAGASWRSQAMPQIEKHSDHSLLRISRVQANAHSGRYTCAAKNQFGQDSSSVNLLVNVKLQWIKEPAREIVVSLNQELKVDCLAQGEPRPTMRWEKLDSLQSQAGAIMQRRPASNQNLLNNSNNNNKQHRQQQTNADQSAPPAGGLYGADPAQSLAGRSNQLASSGAGSYKPTGNSHHRAGPQSANGNLLVSSSGQLAIQRVRESDSGVYECVASNSRDADLRKLVHVQVRGPPKILPIATADSYPEGSSINLICTVSGGQRRGLTLSWTVNGEPFDEDKLKGYSTRAQDEFGANNVAINTDDADISILKIKNATLKNSGHYTCTAKNPLGQDSTSVNIVINVELKWTKTPKDKVEVGLGQQLTLDCDAVGSPQPVIEWTKHSSDANNHDARPVNGTHFVAKGKQLRIQKTQHTDSGLYECNARNGAGPDLRKFVQVLVRGK